MFFRLIARELMGKDLERLENERIDIQGKLDRAPSLTDERVGKMMQNERNVYSIEEVEAFGEFRVAMLQALLALCDRLIANRKKETGVVE